MSKSTVAYLLVTALILGSLFWLYTLYSQQQQPTTTPETFVVGADDICATTYTVVITPSPTPRPTHTPTPTPTPSTTATPRVTSTPTPTPTPSPTATPTPTPTVPPIMACLDLTPEHPNVNPGQSLVFTCSATNNSTIARYANFKMVNSNDQTVASENNRPLTNLQAAWEVNAPTTAGNYEVFCQICNGRTGEAGTRCTNWGKAN